VGEGIGSDVTREADVEDDQRFTGLLDAEARHRAAPWTFSIPRADVRRTLRVGSRVKLLFGTGPADQPGVERMWVEVVAVADGRYRGRLDNDPVAVSDLRVGDDVSFGPEHVAAIWRETGHEPRPEQWAIVSQRIWRGGAVLDRAVRLLVPDPSMSGWVILSADDGPMPPPDLAGFEPVAHQALVDRFRAFDSIEDEPPGTAWQWDDKNLEWVATQSGTPASPAR
jgi:hypothetical protein